ncbi:hypothetical protein SS50377_25265 [Spironucleus salmonicida]|uniref:Uncharacterized protein n=1 Tax=Spironucleus salmonicida TaxID=348837 RepID=V6LMB1_9EUKA|nr:hypothetical protein SS50377_25265 [Spironucleus salmonicida]|eukprot:EST41854.1 Hypothetical protein SS50377_ja037 [Spironucleus salmonicida]
MLLKFHHQRSIAIACIRANCIDYRFIRRIFFLKSNKYIDTQLQAAVERSEILQFAMTILQSNLDEQHRNVCTNMLRQLTQSTTRLGYDAVREYVLLE